MLQRAKSSEAARLAVVPPQADAPAHETKAPAQDASFHDNAAPAAKGGLGAVLKANRKHVLMGLGAVLLAGAAWTGFNYVTAGRFMVATDDAYVRADATTLAAKVPGYVAQIVAADNAPVRAGEVIARIDNGDLEATVVAISRTPACKASRLSNALLTRPALTASNASTRRPV